MGGKLSRRRKAGARAKLLDDEFDELGVGLGLAQAGREAEERWIRRFSERSQEQAPDIAMAATEAEVQLSRLLVDRGLAASRKEAERLISQGAVSLDGQKAADPALRLRLHSGTSVLVKVGKLKLERWVIT